MKKSCVSLLLLLAPSCFAIQQQSTPPADSMVLSVVVTDTAGKPVTGLSKDDFAVLDNKRETAIESFKAVDPTGSQDSATAVMLVVDAVNSNPQNIVFVQQQVRAFLARPGALGQPTSIVLYADSGTPEAAGPGANKSAAPADRKTLLRIIGPSTDRQVLMKGFEEAGGFSTNVGHTGFYGAEERVRLSLKTIYTLIAGESQKPGRKAMIWISAGWPLMSGEDNNSRDMVFNSVVALSKALQQAEITLYDVNPLGVTTGGAVFRTNTVSNQMGHFAVHESTETPSDANHAFQAYLKSPATPAQARFNHMALQVLSIASGGQVFTLQNDLQRMISDCIADANSYYLLTVPTAKAKSPNEFHTIEVKTRKHGVVHAVNGYYAQP